MHGESKYFLFSSIYVYYIPFQQSADLCVLNRKALIHNKYARGWRNWLSDYMQFEVVQDIKYPSKKILPEVEQWMSCIIRIWLVKVNMWGERNGRRGDQLFSFIRSDASLPDNPLSISQSLYLSVSISLYLSIIYLSNISPSTYLCISQSLHLSLSSIFYLSIIYLSFYLSSIYASSIIHPYNNVEKEVIYQLSSCLKLIIVLFSLIC